MKVLKIKIFQETACYRKPFAFKVTETFPLPPYSTIKGMLHYVLSAKEYIPMAISVQGDYESIINSYNNTYFYKSDEITTMPMNVHMLYNVKLIIHVKTEESIMEKLFQKLNKPFEHLSLGRREDLARIDYVKVVKLKEITLMDIEDKEDEDENILPYVETKYPIYIPKNKLDKNLQLPGINYRLNFKYKIRNGLREWEKTDVLYVDKGIMITKGKVWMDEEEDLVFFNIDL